MSNKEKIGGPIKISVEGKNQVVLKMKNFQIDLEKKENYESNCFEQHNFPFQHLSQTKNT